MTFSNSMTIVGSIIAVLSLALAWRSTRSARIDIRIAKFNENRWRSRRDQLSLVNLAWRSSPPSWKVGDLPLLVEREWIPSTPLELDDVEIVWVEWEEGRPPLERSRALARKQFERLGLSHGTDYSAALRELGGLDHLFDGKIYRLLSVESDSKFRLRVTEGSYFDYLDTNEVLVYEATSHNRLNRRGALGGKYRKFLGDPFDLTNRVASLGINTLTLRITGDSATFFLLRRDPDRVANDSEFYSVIPSGEFTPSDQTEEALQRDLNIWRNIVREYAEEFLGIEEAHGREYKWIDYLSQPPYRDLEAARHAGLMRVKVLGFGLDPLIWKPELLTVCLVDASCFDRIFVNIISRNDEGEVVTGSATGLPFDEATVTRYLNARSMSPSGKACLSLAWQHRSILGL